MPKMGTKMPTMGMSNAKSDKQQPISMVDALFTNTQQSVLALLFGQTGQNFYTNEIIRRAGGGSGAVQRELARLVRSGLVTVTRIGSQNHYQANPDAPIFEELSGLIQKTAGLATPIRNSLEPVADAISFAFVYGSVAKQHDSAYSDIDLLIISDTLGYADVYALLEPTGQQLGRSIQPTLYTMAELQRRITTDNAFVRRVIEQPKIWIFGDESGLPAG